MPRDAKDLQNNCEMALVDCAICEAYGGCELSLAHSLRQLLWNHPDYLKTHSSSSKEQRMFVRDNLQNFKVVSDSNFPSTNLLMALTGLVIGLFVMLAI
jgi:hypothetical protein